MGFSEPTPIQEQAIGPALAGKDIIGVAQTGTGKTAAFVVPTLSNILDTEFNGKVQSLIIVPTRELAVQIDQNIQGLGYYGGISSIPITHSITDESKPNVCIPHYIRQSLSKENQKKNLTLPVSNDDEAHRGLALTV